jgi:hypothetical protein
MVKILISFEKRHLYFLFFAIGILAFVGVVTSYNPGMSGGTPAIMGHSSDEVDINITHAGSWVTKSLQAAIKDNDFGGNVWVQNGNNISYTGGGVAIGTATPAPGMILDARSGWFSIGDDTSGKIRMGTSGGWNYIESFNGSASGSDNLAITGSWTQRMTTLRLAADTVTADANIIASGSVGIGITPAGKFQVYDSNLNVYTSDGVSNGWTKNGLTVHANSDAGYSTLRVTSGHAAVSDRGLFNVDRSGTSYMYVRMDGNVGIGTTSPGAKLDVNGNIKSGMIQASGSYLGVKGTATAVTGAVGVEGEAAGPSGGIAGIGVRGIASGSNNWAFYALAKDGARDYGSSSSIRWKRNIQPMNNALSEVLAMRGVYFDWDAAHGGQHSMGMIAEEVGKVVPEVVSYEANGVDATGMDYGRLTPVLVEAIKQQQQQIQQLKQIVCKDHPNESVCKS